MSTIVFPRTLRQKIGEDGSGNYPHIRIATVNDVKEIEAIHLYAPQGIQVGDGANYNGLELGVIKGAQDAIDKFKAGDFAMSNDQSLVMGIKALDKLGVDASVSSAAALESNVAFNQQTALAFEGMNLRQFNFSFTLVPESAAESEDIRKIENFFRKYMYSEVDGFVAKFPEKFRIKFFDGAEENPFMPYIHDCFLSSLETTYNPESNMYYDVEKDGKKFKAPQSVTISLTFSEARLLSRQDIYGMEGDDTTREGLDYDYTREKSQQGGKSFSKEELKADANKQIIKTAQDTKIAADEANKDNK